MESISEPPPATPVLHFLDAFREESGGVVRAVLDLCGGLAARGTAVTVATYDDADVPASWRQGAGDVPRVVLVPRRTPPPRELLLENRVVHLHTPWDRSNLAWARRCRGLRRPYVLSAHGMLDDWSMRQKAVKKRVYLRMFGRRLLEGAYRVHCTAEGEAQQAARWFPRGRSQVIPLVIDLPAADALPPPETARQAFPALATQRPKLLFLSRLHPKKGVDVLLHAAAALAADGQGFELFIAGPGEAAYVAQLKRLAEQLQLVDRVHFLGMVQGPPKLSLYQACDLFVLPTHQENFGLVLVESLVCGTPVVTTRGVDIWPEIERGGGVCIDRPDAGQLHQALGPLLREVATLPERGRQGRQFVLQWLDSQRIVAAYQQLYHNADAEAQRQASP